MDSLDSLFMKRAIELAQMGAGLVAPNPLVGCVLVHSGKIIGEGFHARYGEAHAEVQAIRSVNQHDLLPGATLYVSLEPCSHTGKTPPCTKLILESGIRKVVVATEDPNPVVSGSGIRLLRQAGIEVKKDILRQEAAHLNRRFFTFHKQKRPYIILRWAESADGFIDPVRKEHTRKSIPISSALSRQMSHRWRSEEQAILVGANTAINDNPSLVPTLWPGNTPLRLILDSKLRTPPDSRLFTDGHPTFVFNRLKHGQEGNLSFNKVNQGLDMIEAMKAEMYRQNILSVMVEGGAGTIRSFLSSGNWDEIRRFRSPDYLGEGLAAPQISIQPDQRLEIGDDLLEIAYNPGSDFI